MFQANEKKGWVKGLVLQSEDFAIANTFLCEAHHLVSYCEYVYFKQ